MANFEPPVLSNVGSKNQIPEDRTDFYNSQEFIDAKHATKG